MHHCVLNHGTLKYQLESNEPGRMILKISARINLGRPETFYQLFNVAH